MWGAASAILPFSQLLEIFLFLWLNSLLLYEELLLMSSAAHNFSSSSSVYTSSSPGLPPVGVSLSPHFLCSEVSTWIFCFSMLCFVMAGQVIWQCCSPDTILVLKKLA